MATAVVTRTMSPARLGKPGSSIDEARSVSRERVDAVRRAVEVQLEIALKAVTDAIKGLTIQIGALEARVLAHETVARRDREVILLPFNGRIEYNQN